ncbi:protein-tyrosine-phosphatase, variant 2 [Balamuthia mandrillaris]
MFNTKPAKRPSSSTASSVCGDGNHDHDCKEERKVVVGSTQAKDVLSNGKRQTNDEKYHKKKQQQTTEQQTSPKKPKTEKLTTPTTCTDATTKDDKAKRRRLGRGHRSTPASPVVAYRRRASTTSLISSPSYKHRPKGAEGANPPPKSPKLARLAFFRNKIDREGKDKEKDKQENEKAQEQQLKRNRKTRRRKKQERRRELGKSKSGGEEPDDFHQHDLRQVAKIDLRKPRAGIVDGRSLLAGSPTTTTTKTITTVERDCWSEGCISEDSGETALIHGGQSSHSGEEEKEEKGKGGGAKAKGKGWQLRIGGKHHHQRKDKCKEKDKEKEKEKDKKKKKEKKESKESKPGRNIEVEVENDLGETDTVEEAKGKKGQDVCRFSNTVTSEEDEKEEKETEEEGEGSSDSEEEDGEEEEEEEEESEEEEKEEEESSSDTESETGRKKKSKAKAKNKKRTLLTTSEMEEAKLQSEFEQLALQEQRKAKPDFNFALEYHNIHKNRYGNVLPNPETRVKLQGGRSSDYINANYVKGESQVYIACQAPLPNTFADFWRMIWEQHSYVIMMLTRLMEKERVKAEKYWPTRGPLSRTRRPGTAESESGGEGGWKQYGSIAVRLERQHQHSAKIIVREFSLRHDSSAEEQGLVDLTDLEERQEQEIRRVVQIHYTGWPDFGRPKSTKTFKKVSHLFCHSLAFTPLPLSVSSFFTVFWLTTLSLSYWD